MESRSLDSYFRLFAFFYLPTFPPYGGLAEAFHLLPRQNRERKNARGDDPSYIMSSSETDDVSSVPCQKAARNTRAPHRQTAESGELHDSPDSSGVRIDRKVAESRKTADKGRRKTAEKRQTRIVNRQNSGRKGRNREVWILTFDFSRFSTFRPFPPMGVWLSHSTFCHGRIG